MTTEEKRGLCGNVVSFGAGNCVWKSTQNREQLMKNMAGVRRSTRLPEEQLKTRLQLKKNVICVATP